MLSGILYYPFELLIDFLNRISTIKDTGTAIINVPEFSLDIMGYHATVINAYSFDLNSILVDDTYKNIHTIYLTVVDIILWLGVVTLAGKTMNSIIGGVGQAVGDDIYENGEDERSYERYSQYQANKQRYKREHGG